MRILVPNGHKIPSRCSPRYGAPRLYFLVFLVLSVCGLWSATLTLPTAAQEDPQEDDPTHIVIPRQLPTPRTRSVAFNDACEWVLREQNVRSLDFSRVVEVQVYWNANRRLMELIASFPSLDSLYIHELPPEDFDFEGVTAPIGDMKKLEYLEFGMVEVSRRRCKFLARLTSLKSFKCDFVLDVADLKALATLPKLEKLDLLAVAGPRHDETADDFPPQAFAHLRELHLDSIDELVYFKGAHNLQKLSGLTVRTVEDVKRISRFASVTELEIYVDSIIVAKPLEKMPNLQVLKLHLLRQRPTRNRASHTGDQADGK